MANPEPITGEDLRRYRILRGVSLAEAGRQMDPPLSKQRLHQIEGQAYVGFKRSREIAEAVDAAVQEQFKQRVTGGSPA
jgi:hypothetical protein